MSSLSCCVVAPRSSSQLARFFKAKTAVFAPNVWCEKELTGDRSSCKTVCLLLNHDSEDTPTQRSAVLVSMVGQGGEQSIFYPIPGPSG